MTLIYITVFMTVLLGFVSLAVDWGHVQLVKTELEAAATAAAHAACTGLNTNVATAQSMAVTWAGYNTADGTAVSVDSNNDVEFGTWDTPSRTFTVLSGSARSSANAVRVWAHRTAARGNATKLWFAPMIGRSTCDATGVAIAWRKNRTILFIVGNTTLASTDQAASDRMVSLGFQVVVEADASAVPADAIGKSLVVISESSTAASVNTGFYNVSAPIVCYEGNCFGFLKMTGPNINTDYGDSATFTQAVIQNSGHPLAAGLSGTVQIYGDGWGEANWGQPNSNAAKVANLVGYSTWYGIFGYDTGATMYSSYVAPSRRVGLLLRQTDLSHVTANGWKFFDAAIKWAVGDI